MRAYRESNGATRRDWYRTGSHPSKNDEEIVVPEVPCKSETTIQPGSDSDGRQAEPGPSKSIEFSGAITVTAWRCSQCRHAGISFDKLVRVERRGRKLQTGVKIELKRGGGGETIRAPAMGSLGISSLESTSLMQLTRRM